MDDDVDLAQELLDESKIFVVHVNIDFGNEEVLSGFSMDHASFYKKSKASMH